MRVAEIRYTGPDPVENGNFEEISSKEDARLETFVNDCGHLEIWIEHEARAWLVHLEPGEIETLKKAIAYIS